MLQRFLASHPITSGPVVGDVPELTPSVLRRLLGGRTFADGLYRTHTEESAAQIGAEIGNAFPEAPPHDIPYGFDWLGRQFCTRTDESGSTTLMFEPGTGEVLEIPIPFSQIHDGEFVDYADEALAQQFFARYLAAGGTAPGLNQCIGYRRPLFLGGEDDVPNLELNDLDVYWTLMGQLILQTKGVPPGTAIDPVIGG